VATGDGDAIAHRAGAKLADMEFVQFPPTALDTAENPLQLISEAVRGEGAVLLNEEGERFMLKKHRLAELAPRDVVAREIFREKAGAGGVARCWMLARNSGNAFPNLPSERAASTIPGSDSRHAGAHYMMGGVVVDLRGHTSLNCQQRVR
jgi:L-aspartate oxidase